MEPVPLIPALNSQTCPDTSQVIREEFQYFLTNKSFPLSIADNLTTFDICHEDLEFCAVDVKNVFQETKLCMEDISYAEKCIMTSQAEYMKQDESETKIESYKAKQNYHDLDERTIKRFSLIQAKDLLGHPTERLLDPFTSIDVTTTCKTICPKTVKTWIDKDEFMTPSKVKMPLYTNESHEIVKEKTDFIKFKTSEKIFEFEPNEIIFENYKKGSQYQKHLHLRNITSKSQNLIVLNPSNPKFNVTLCGNITRLAPCITCDIVVNFKSNNLVDEKEVLCFRTSDSEFYVNLKSVRNPPSLSANILCGPPLCQIKEFRTEDDCNFTFDCGACFLGDYVEFNVKLHNNGNYGKFFLMSEDDWMFLELRDCYAELFLVAANFIIFPIYFELEHDEEIQLVIIYCPTEEGFDTEKIYIMCDNGTKQEIDLMGDCVLYNLDFFSVKLPIYPLIPENDKVPDVPKYLLNIGEVYPKQTRFVEFIIENNSQFSLPYAWQKNDTDSQSQGEYLYLENDHYDIYPESGTFESKSEQRFMVKINMNSDIYGFYSNVLSLYVYDIPENSLEEGVYFVFKDEYFNEERNIKLLSILVEEIAIQLKYIQCPIILYPNSIECESIKINQKAVMNPIKILNYGNQSLQCNWDLSAQLNLGKFFTYFFPRDFILPAKKMVECLFFMEPKVYDDLKRTFKLCVNEDLVRENFVLDVHVQKPKVRLSRTFFTFGNVGKMWKRLFYFTVQNTSAVDVVWFAMEHRYDDKLEKFVKINENNLNVNVGYLTEDKNMDELSYVLNTSHPGKWFSILVFYTIYKSTVTPSAYMAVHSEIIEPVLVISCNGNEDGLLTIEEPLYVHTTSSFDFFLINTSCCRAFYTWRNAHSASNKKAVFQFSQQEGCIGPNVKRLVTLNVTCFCAGYYDLFIPCQIATVQESVILTVQFCVKDLEVAFSIPFGDQYMRVVWPYNEEIEKFNKQLEISEFEEFIRNYIEENFNKKLIEIEREKIIETVTEEEEQKNENNVDVDENESKNSLKGDTKKCRCCKRGDCRIKSTESLDSKQSVQVIFGKEVNLNKYLIEYNDIEFRKPSKQTVYIQNNTPVVSEVKVSTKNFRAKEAKDKTCLQNLLEEMKWKEKDEWEDVMTSSGIVVLTKPNYHKLDAFSLISVDIWVFAETWGSYLEELTFNIEYIPAFAVSLLINVTCSPIEYPININTNLPTPILRFGSFTYNSKSNKRSLKIFNRSTINCTVVWHVFNQNDQEHPSPFNVLYDIYSPDDLDFNVDFKIKLIKTLGTEHMKRDGAFEITPRETHLGPKEYNNISITFKPKKFQPSFENFDVTALLIGHVYINENHSFCPDLFARFPDKLTPTKVQLKAHIETPQLELMQASNETDNIMIVDDIIIRDKNVKTLRYLFKNNGFAPIIVRLETSAPFRIVSMETMDSDCVDVERCLACVRAGQCLEVKIKCTIETKLICKMASIMYQNNNISMKDVFFLENNNARFYRTLKIFYNDLIHQTLSLYITLKFPLFYVSTTYLDFGSVLVKNKKREEVKMANESDYDLWFTTKFENDPRNIFYVTPPTGFISPSLISEKYFHLSIYFEPQKECEYANVLIIQSCLLQCTKRIILLGKGSNDSIYAVPSWRNI